MKTEFKAVRKQYRIIALLAVWRWLAIIVIAVIGIIVAGFLPERNPVDNQATRSREFVKQILVVDDRRNGFRVFI